MQMPVNMPISIPNANDANNVIVNGIKSYSVMNKR